MPLPHWNHVWTGPDVAGSKHLDIITRYWAAYNERKSWFSGALSSLASAVGDSVLVASGSTGWALLQSATMALAQFFARKVLADGTTPYSPQGLACFDSPLQTLASMGATPTKLPFPAPHGWARKFPREIWTLDVGSCPGTAGQRARFTARSDFHGWRSCLSTDAAFGTTVTTPMGERIYSGKFMDFTAGAWVVSTDQLTSADVITEQVGDGTTPFIPYQKGDFFGEWILNDLRDALNQLTVIPTINDPGFFPTAGYIPLTGFGSGASGTISSGERCVMAGNTAGNSGASFVSAAAAAADYTGGTHIFATPGDDNYEEGGLATVFTFTGGGGVQWTLNARTFQARVIKSNPGPVTAVWPNPLAQACKVGYWSQDLNPNYPATNDFDANGTGSLDQLWNQWGAAAIADPGAFGTTIGVVPAGAPAFPAAGGPSRGFAVGMVCLVCDFECAGGFAWTASTP